MKVPHRSLLSKRPTTDVTIADQNEDKNKCANNNGNTHSATVSIIGLGCSSFSTFFFTDEEKSTLRQSSLLDQLSMDLISRDHPIVQEWIETIKYAILDCGITLLDTAPWYGHGTSEIVIGYAMQDILNSHHDDDYSNLHHNVSSNENYTERQPHTDTKINRSSLIINTKVGRYESNPIHQFDYSYDKTIQSVQLSLTRLQCTYIDVVQLHDPEYSPSISLLLDETIPAMLQCRDKFKYCKSLGITGYPLQIQYEILKRSKSMYGFVFDQALTYGHFNLHDDSLFTKTISSLLSLNPTTTTTSTNNQDDYTECQSSFAQYCISNSIHLLAAAPLSMGLLTNHSPPSWHPASLELRNACQAASILCSTPHDTTTTHSNSNNDSDDNGGTNVNISTLAILYALSHDNIVCTIIGMKNRKEVDEAVKAACRFLNSTATTTDNNSRSSSTNYSSASTDTCTSPIRTIESNLKQELYKTTNSKLDLILTPEERSVLNKLQDVDNGPFSEIWKSDDTTSNYSSQYQWDGNELANKFWEEIPGGKEEAEKRMRIRNTKK